MLGHVAVGTWSGGRFMRFGEPISDERLEALLRPAEASTRSSRPTPTAPARPTPTGPRPAGVPRAHYRSSAPSATTSTRASATAPRVSRASPTRGCAGPTGIATTSAWRSSGASSAAGRLFELLLLHNPDRRGFESPEVWDALRELRDDGLAGEIGVAPGPANGFTLDLIGCFERYGDVIDWAMLILNPSSPGPASWPSTPRSATG